MGDTHIDTDMDTIEERDPPMLNLKLKLSHGTVGVDTMVDIHTDMVDMDTTEERDLPMLSQLLKPKLSHGTMLVTMDTHTLMVVITDTLIAITTLERDQLMLNQKPNHGMATEDTTATLTDMDIDTGVKPFQ